MLFKIFCQILYDIWKGTTKERSNGIFSCVTKLNECCASTPWMTLLLKTWAKTDVTTFEGGRLICAEGQEQYWQKDRLIQFTHTLITDSCSTLEADRLLHISTPVLWMTRPQRQQWPALPSDSRTDFGLPIGSISFVMDLPLSLSKSFWRFDYNFPNGSVEITYSKHWSFVIPVSLKLENVSDSSFTDSDVRDVTSSLFLRPLPQSLQSSRDTEENS